MQDSDAYAARLHPASALKRRPVRLRPGAIRFWLPWLLVLVATVALTVAARHAPPFPGDVGTARAVQTAGDAIGAESAARVVNACNSGGRITALAALGLGIGIGLRRWDLVLWYGSASLLRPYSVLLKWLTERPRPSAALVRVSEWPADASFPSGHVFSAALGYGLFALLLEVVPMPHGARRALQTAAVANVLLVGAARIYVGAHWPSDVLGSLLWAGLILAVIARAGPFRANGRTPVA